ncbi:MAG: cyclic nucleotide-binding domain-containing protein, partial [bacterium]
MPDSPYFNINHRSDNPARYEERLFSFFKNRTPALRNVPVPALKGLAQGAALRYYTHGQYIYQVKDPARELWVILEGMVCINRCSLKGNRVSVELFTEGDIFGLRALHRAPACAQCRR